MSEQTRDNQGNTDEAPPEVGQTDFAAIVDEMAASKPSDATTSGSELDQLRAELEAARTQASEHLATLTRTAADFANYRRRTGEERESAAANAAEDLLRALLPIIDDLDRASGQLPPELAGVSWVEGILMIDRKLRLLLESQGVRAIEAQGQPFDPREHEALGTVPTSESPDGTVVIEAQRGYRLGGKVLRPAMVMIATTPNPDEPPLRELVRPLIPDPTASPSDTQETTRGGN